MRYIYILSSLLLFNNCSVDTHFKIGLYKSFIPTKIEMCWNAIFSNIYGYVVKTDLIINKDSTFKFSTCSSVSTGNWAISKDSLLLHVNEFRWKNDSLNKVGYYNGSWPNLPSKLIGFRIYSNYLETTVSNKRHKTILLLKFDIP